MSNFSELLQTISCEKSYHDKQQLLQILLITLEKVKLKKIKPEEREELIAFAFSELESAIDSLQSLSTYREKDERIEYASGLVALPAFCYGAPQNMPPERLQKLRSIGEIIVKERFLEQEVHAIINRGKLTEEDLNRLICMASPLKDEYQKSRMVAGLVHYRQLLESCSEGCRKLLADYTAAELRRYTELPSFDEDVLLHLELLCDVCSFCMTDELAALLGGLITRVNHDTLYYLCNSLLQHGYAVPDRAIEELAADLVYADMIHSALVSCKQQDRMPAQYRDPIYLAKSDMVHWLVYPTELGKEPDEIEYLGEVTKHGERYRLFRFRSESDTLSEELKGKWLIGWSSEDGGTFSQFDEYERFVKKTPEKTLKYIRAKLL